MIQWLRELWAYYLVYTKQPVHAASAAAFAIFGLLVFVDPLFAILAIVSYVVPPVFLYIREDGPPATRADIDERGEARPTREGSNAERGVGVNSGSGSGSNLYSSSDTDSDSDRDDGDTDTDTDTDSGTDGDSNGDSDSDSDSDHDNGDSDSDSDSD